MLARGVLCRLAAEVPKTATHDLPRISLLLQSALSARNGASRPIVGAIACASQATILQGRRGYATKTAKAATTSTTRVKKDVKKTAAKKPAKKTAAKKTAATKPKRKTAAKKKAAPKKPARKPKKVLTKEEKEAAVIKELKKKALRAPKAPTVNAWMVFSNEALSGAASFGDVQQRVKDAAAKYKNLTPAEREHYNHLAKERTAARQAEYDTWIRQHTPDEIRIANNARSLLRRKLGATARPGSLSEFKRLVDPRQEPARNKMTPYIRFVKERHASGDFKGIKATDFVKLAASEWNALSAGEKKKYQDENEAAKAA